MFVVSNIHPRHAMLKSLFASFAEEEVLKWGEEIGKDEELELVEEMAKIKIAE
jgi:hypothetical protein